MVDSGGARAVFLCFTCKRTAPRLSRDSLLSLLFAFLLCVRQFRSEHRVRSEALSVLAGAGSLSLEDKEVIMDISLIRLNVGIR